MKNITNSFSLPRVILAPLSGITSLPFRTLNRKAGCQFAFLEMVCARSLFYGSKKNKEMMMTDAHDRPLGVQLLGDDLEYILKAVERLQGYPYDLLDFNAACPQKKVTSKGKGAALLQDTAKLSVLLKGIVREVSSPVTVKLRLGWDWADHAVDIARCAQDSGVSAVFVHGRTRRQGYRGEVDYASIAKIKAALNIPVVGSGNIFSGPLAQKMFTETGCDAVLVARGALGNPWIFREIEAYLSSGAVLSRPNVEEIARVMKEHFALLLGFYEESIAVRTFRKFFMWYTRGLPRVRPLRACVVRITRAQDMFALIDSLMERKENYAYSSG